MHVAVFTVFTVGSSAVDPLRLLLWCCLVTRTVSQNSVEGEAIKKELYAHCTRGTSDLESVRGKFDWMSHPLIPEYRRWSYVPHYRSEEF